MINQLYADVKWMWADINNEFTIGYCSHAADKAANDRAEYGPHRYPLKPAQGSALMCAQVINLAVGDDLRASRSKSVSQWGPYIAQTYMGSLRHCG